MGGRPRRSPAVRRTNRRSGLRSYLDVNTIVTVRSIDPVRDGPDVPCLTNRALFRRDDFTCLYCGSQPGPRLLTRDHVVPLSQGGANRWENVVTACRACNQRKDDRSLDALGRTLLALPYEPNRAEGPTLANRRFLADQTAILPERVGRESRLKAA